MNESPTLSSSPSSPCCHQQTVVGVLFTGALSSALRSSHSLIAVRFVAFLRIGCSCQLVVVVVVFILFDVVVVIVVVVVTTPRGVIVIVSVVDY